MRRVLLGVLVVATLVPTVPAVAHPTRGFEACAAYQRVGGQCRSDGGTYLYGMTMHLRATVEPEHADLEAQVWRQRPRSQVWRLVERGLAISERGVMRWSWPTTIDDADQVRPYHFRFRVPGHGRSEALEVWVIFGE